MSKNYPDQLPNEGTKDLPEQLPNESVYVKWVPVLDSAVCPLCGSKFQKRCLTIFFEGAPICQGCEPQSHLLYTAIKLALAQAAIVSDIVGPQNQTDSIRILEGDIVH